MLIALALYISLDGAVSVITDRYSLGHVAQIVAFALGGLGAWAGYRALNPDA